MFPTVHFKSVSALVAHKMKPSLSCYVSVRVQSPEFDPFLSPVTGSSGDVSDVKDCDADWSMGRLTASLIELILIQPADG